MDTSLKNPSSAFGRGDPLVGQVLDGRYRVDARIAVGGMATVYRAMDTRLDRVQALKVMHPSLATDDAFVARFIREAKSAARLAHPNVVGVYDQGTDGTYVYLAMEYVSGCTLRDVLRERGALQPRAALDILEPILAALGAAHRAGLVHRDMKPENVLIGDDGRVKVADFGLVRAVDSQTSATTDSILGTVSYLAPEQIEDGTADTRTDLYACGVMLYEMLTGSKPHAGGSPAQVLYLHLHKDTPAPSVAVPGLAPALDGLVARATARDPERRPEDAVALLSEVRTARAGLAEAELDAVPPQAKSVPGAGAATGAVAGAYGAAAAAGEGDDGPSGTSGSVPAADGSGQPGAAGDAPGAGAGSGEASAAHGDAGAEASTYVIPRSVLGTGQGVPDAAAHGAHGEPLPGGEPMAHTTRLSVPPDEPHGPPAGTGRPGRRRRPGLGVLVALGVLLALLLGTGIWYINSGQFTQTPPVLDKTQAQATKVLSDAGLDVTVERDYSERVKRGHVIGTDPNPGERVRKTGSVTLTVSRGPKVVKTPDLEGTPLSNARRELKQAGLEPGVVKRRFDEETAQGSVISTDPPAGARRSPGSAVALTVSKGEPVEVPDVAGDEQNDAAKELREEGLKVRIAAKRVHSEEDKGTVARTSPAEGSEAAKGDTVTLTLSKGPDMVEVPDVEDSSEDEARQKLEKEGFTVSVRRVFFGDKVFNQDPDGGDDAPRGSEITIWLR